MNQEKIRNYVFYVFITFVGVISILILIDNIVKVKNIITIEALTDMSEDEINNNNNNKNGVSSSDIRMDPAGDFCNSRVGSSNTLVDSCKKLTNQNCNLTSCCVMLNGTDCVPGDKDGPTFKTSDGKNTQIDYYYYQNKKYQVQNNTPKI